VLTAEIVSRLGSQLSALALPWFVLITTGSVTRMGLVYAIELVPVAVLGIPSGLLVARIGVRKTMFAGEGLSAIVAGLIPLLHWAGLLPFWLLLVLVGVMGLVAAPFLAAQRLLLPEVLGDDQVAVMKGNALVESGTRVAALAGPAAAGFLIVTLGALNVLWVDAASYLLSFGLLIGLPRPKADLSAAAKAAGGLRAGARYIARDPVVSRVIVAAFGYGFLFPFVLISLPILAKVRYGGDPRIAGWLLAAWGGGALLGTFGVMRLAKRLPPMRMGALGGLCMAIPLWFLPLHQPAITVGISLLVCGVFTSMLNSPLIALLTTRPPAALRAQVVTFTVTTNFLAAPLAYVIAGSLFSRFGLSHVQLAVAIAITACALLLISLIRYDPAAAQDGAAPAPAPAAAADGPGAGESPASRLAIAEEAVAAGLIGDEAAVAETIGHGLPGAGPAGPDAGP
jgi:MFS family permease